ncbi:hypothetical protein [Streptomyces sp. NPDC046261]|uniref:hypothetical protein n=1 Tax=Streptomyces sp. NPDC046261 TaxID=3157200 RepID=UPI0033E43676
MAGHSTVVVHPPSPSGGRRVSVGTRVLGTAYGLVDLLELLVKAGVVADDVRLEEAETIDWRGGGPHIW